MIVLRNFIYKIVIYNCCCKVVVNSNVVRIYFLLSCNNVIFNLNLRSLFDINSLRIRSIVASIIFLNFLAFIIIINLCTSFSK